MLPSDPPESLCESDSGIFIEASYACPPHPARNIAHTSRRSGVFLLPRPRKFGRHPRLVCPQAAAKRKHREEDREVDSGETHSAKESAKEVKQLLPAGARIQIGENAGDERGVTSVLLHVPLIGRIARLQAIGRISFVMSTLLRSGLVLVRAMEIAANSCPNVILAAALRTVREALISGQDVGQALAGTSEFPPMVVQIFAVGQHSGELDSMLEKLSQDCDRQSELLSTRMATLAEPIVIVSLTVIVGFIMLATILPILEAGQDL